MGLGFRTGRVSGTLGNIGCQQTAISNTHRNFSKQNTLNSRSLKTAVDNLFGKAGSRLSGVSRQALQRKILQHEFHSHEADGKLTTTLSPGLHAKQISGAGTPPNAERMRLACDRENMPPVNANCHGHLVQCLLRQGEQCLRASVDVPNLPMPYSGKLTTGLGGWPKAQQRHLSPSSDGSSVNQPSCCWIRSNSSP